MSRDQIYLRYERHLVTVSRYKPEEHGVYDDLYRGHGPHHTHVIHHQEPVHCHVVQAANTIIHV